MTDERMVLIELVENRADGDLMREMLAFAAGRIMAAELEGRIGAAKGAPTPMREVQRNIYVRSRRSGERVVTNVTSFVTKRLELRVNTVKSAATPCDQDRIGTPGRGGRPSRRKFRGFSFTAGQALPRRRIAPPGYSLL